MKKALLFVGVCILTFIISGSGALAQTDTPESAFTLEEIMVTAEKRSVNLQTVASSITALEGSALAEQGKITTAEILESVPNVSYRGDTNITIRGVKKTQQPGGASPVPQSTANYVDDVYGGIGGNFDINRVEVLRGPQGTLYGRSATGGVVAFHTNDPALGKLSANISDGYGSGARINHEAAINVPLGGKVALRAAFHYLHQDEGWFNGAGGENETKEGRIKALFQPTDGLSFILSVSAARSQSFSGGWQQTLTAPNTINYKGVYNDPSEGVPTKDKQGSLHVSYDLESSNLTYIAAIHTNDNRGTTGIGLNRGSWQQNIRTGSPTKTMTHEVRWESSTEGFLTWLIGSNYYKNTYDINGLCMQISQEGELDPRSFNAHLFEEMSKGTIINYGLFTEETFNLRDNMRLTAGLRYDKTNIKNYSGRDFNMALLPSGASYNPPNIVHYPADSEYYLDDPDFNNFTYKVRFEYDLTPENMLYALTATGFLPGDSQISVGTEMAPVNGVFQVTDVYFKKLPFEQQLLTSYEVGSKNRFMDNKLQLNGSLFYYDYEGYQEAVNIKPAGSPPPPEFVVLRLPVRMIGLEMDGTWLLSQNDRVSFSAGWLDATLKSYPNVPGSTESAKQFMYLKDVPGLEKTKATLSYDHTFLFENGAALVPRAEARYTGGYYLSQATTEEANRGDLPYIHQGSTVLGNISATLTSPEGNFSAIAYVRNVFDKEYKTGVQVPSGPQGIYTVSVGEPRTFGVTFSAKF